MRRHSPFRSTAVAALAVLLVVSGAGAAAAVDDYPTWEDVRAAQGSEEAKQAEYERLQDAMKRAQADAEVAAVHAAETSAAARLAERELETATKRERDLEARAAQSEKDVEKYSDELARLVSWMYTNGTGLASTSQLITSEDPDEYMAKLSIASQVSGTWDTLAERATTELNTASSLQKQAESARTERDRLAKEAETVAAEAATAQAEADSAVAAANEHLTTVYAQLASLQGTTADVERRYQIGLQVAAQGQNEPGGGGGGSTGGGGGGVSVDPAGAQAYARSVLPSYGWGDGEFSCLVSLWNGESNWRADALNPYSGAYGIPQSLPAEKMATAGPDWRTNGNTQVDWGLAYISAAYGSPCNAWGIWQARNPHWY